jgi:hypothetical protein
MTDVSMTTYFTPDSDEGIELPSSLTIEQAQATLQHSMGYNSVAGAKAVTRDDGVHFERAQGTDKG